VTRLCLIGNSHLTALRRGWLSLPERPADLSATFFGSMRDSLRFLEIRDGKLVAVNAFVRHSLAVTSGGLSEIDPAAYDAFVLVGLSASMKRALRFYRFHRWFGQTESSETTLLRRNLALETLVAEFSNTRLVELGLTLRLLTEKPIFAFAEPYFALQSRGSSEGLGTDGMGMATLFNDALTSALAKANIRFLPQPSDTVADHVHTDDRFNVPDPDRTPPRAKSVDEPDYAHMNTSYGVVCWRDLLAQLST
jgi:hypothetical protein